MDKARPIRIRCIWCDRAYKEQVEIAAKNTVSRAAGLCPECQKGLQKHMSGGRKHKE